MGKLVLIVSMVVFLSLIETSLVSIPLVLITVISVALRLEIVSSLWFALGAGIIFDLLFPRILGVSSLFFLIVTVLITRYRIKWETHHWIVVLVFSLVASCLYSFLFFHSVTPGFVVGVLVSSVVIHSTVSVLFARFFPSLFHSFDDQLPN